MYLLILSSLCITGVLSGPAITLMKCDPGNDQCVLDAVKEAFPLVLEENAAIGAENMDPLYQEEINVDLPMVKSTVSKATTKGLRTCHVENAKLDANNLGLHVQLQCPGFAMKGLYKVKGTLNDLPLEGNGEFSVETKLYETMVNAELQVVPGSDGNNYLTVKDFSLQADPKDEVISKFTNLGNGQKELSDAHHTYANENWKEFVTQFQEPIIKANIQKIVDNANKYLKTVPVEQFLKI